MSTDANWPDAEALYVDLVGGCKALLQEQTRLVGIASGGVWLAARLQRDLARPGTPGVISSTLHRDDFAQRGLGAPVQTALPFKIDGADLMLVDDVLHTGRTIRAVLNELFDFGRPARVRLAVLVDRIGRELPVAADYASARLELAHTQSLELRQGEAGRLHFQLHPA